MYSLFKRLLFVLVYLCLINTAVAETQNFAKQLAPINVEITTHLGDDQSFVEGDQISFMLTLDKASFIYLFYQDADNNIVQLVPNYKQSSNFYQPGLFIPIPDEKANFNFTVQPPFGEEKLWVFATDQQVDEFINTVSDKELKLLELVINDIRFKIKSQATTLYGESRLTILVTEE